MNRLLTPKFEEAIKDYPLYSQDGKGRDAVCVAIFTIGNHSDNAVALFTVVEFDIGKFVERHIAVFIFAESDHYAVKNCIVSLFASFKHKPTDMPT